MRFILYTEKVKKLVVLLVIVLASVFVIPTSLSRAIQKDFWTDERSEIDGILSRSYSVLLGKGAKAQYSGSPLYFLTQKYFVSQVLENEIQTKSGYPWKVSFRFFPALSWALGILVTSLLLFKLHWVLGLAFACYAGAYNFGIYYSSESRPYAMWLAQTCVYLAVGALWFCNERSRILGPLWALISLILSLTMITSPAQVFACALLLALLFLLTRKFSKPVFLWLSVGCGLSVMAMMIYNVFPVGKVANPYESYFTWSHFLEYGLMPLEGWHKTVKLVLYGTLLVVVGWFSHLKFRKIYLVCGTLGLSQIALLPVIYVAQFRAGSYFAQRHGIFAVAGRALIAAACALLFYEIAKRVFERFFDRKHLPIFKALVFVIIIYDWMFWIAKDQWEFLENIRKTYSTNLCVGPINIEVPATLTNKDAIEDYKFNSLDYRRHNGLCADGPPKGSEISYDFKIERVFEN